MRKISGNFSVAFVVAMALLFGISTLAAAQDAGSGTATPAKVSTGQQLKETLVESFFCNPANSCSFVPGNELTAADSPVKIKCTDTCTILATGTVMMGGGSTGSNAWAVCLEVDGAVIPIKPPIGCPVQGYLPTDKSYVTGPLTSSLLVDKGTHTVQTMLSTVSGGNLGGFNIVYQDLSIAPVAFARRSVSAMKPAPVTLFLAVVSLVRALRWANPLHI